MSSHPIYTLCSRQIHEQDNMKKIQTEIIQWVNESAFVDSGIYTNDLRSLQSNDEPMSPDAVSNLIEMKVRIE